MIFVHAFSFNKSLGEKQIETQKNKIDNPKNRLHYSKNQMDINFESKNTKYLNDVHIH